MTPRIHLIRHGQGFHQLEPLQEHRQIPDPSLTDLGVERCKGFNAHFPEYIHIDLVCASPMKRTIQTAMYCFHDRIPATPRHNILLLPLAQENTAEPCDIGSDPEDIRREWGDIVDTALVGADWTAKKGIYAPSPEALVARARELRRWLRHRPENEIVVVGHGAFWDYVIGQPPTAFKSGWENREWRSFTFASEDEDEAWLVEEKESVVRRHLLDSPL